MHTTLVDALVHTRTLCARFMEETRTPKAVDVLCGKDKTFQSNPGNLIYRKLIEDRSRDYASATSKRAKMDISKSIITTMQYKHGSRFLRQATVKLDQQEGWVELNSQQARDKATHALRFWNDYKPKKKPPDNEGDIDDEAAIASSTLSSRVLPFSPVARAPSAADLDSEVASSMAAYQHPQQSVPSTSHDYYQHSPYPYQLDHQQSYQSMQYQHHQSTPQYYGMRGDPRIGYSAEQPFATSNTNDDEQSSHVAEEETDTTTEVAVVRYHERQQQFARSSLRHDHHPYPRPAALDEENRREQLRPANEDTLDAAMASFPYSESIDESDSFLALPTSQDDTQYPSSPVFSSIEDPDRNSLMLLSTVRSLSLVDYLEDDSNLMPAHHRLDETFATSSSLDFTHEHHLLDHPHDQLHSAENRNSSDNRRRTMTHTEATGLDDATDQDTYEALWHEPLGSSGGSSGSVPPNNVLLTRSRPPD